MITLSMLALIRLFIIIDQIKKLKLLSDLKEFTIFTGEKRSWLLFYSKIRRYSTAHDFENVLPCT